MRNNGGNHKEPKLKMPFFKKKVVENTQRDEVILAHYMVKINGLFSFAEGNDKVKGELEALQQKFQYTVPTAVPGAKDIEKDITATYAELEEMIMQPNWDEATVSLKIKTISKFIDDLNSLRAMRK